MEESPYAIHYLGKTYNTTIHKDLTDEEYEQVVKEYYTKPDFELVQKQFKTISKGGVKVNHITNYYVKDLMAKVKLFYNNWSIEEALLYKPLVEFFAGKADKNKKVFPDSHSLCKKIETAFRLCGFKTASKPSNFPMKSIDELLENYNVNNKYYDFSCGWGVRLLSSLKHNVEYYGTDPNTVLCERLQQMGDDYKTTVGCKTNFHIYGQGSEEFIPQLENQIGFAFSSPPYFNLEDYKIGNQSYKPGISYEEWKKNYLEPTIKNIYKYLINDGYFAININNFNNYNDYDLVGNTYDIALSSGFKLVDVLPMKNITRCSGHKEWNKGDICWHDNDEKIMVFQKERKEINEEN